MKLDELTNRDASWDVVEILTTMDSIPTIMRGKLTKESKAKLKLWAIGCVPPKTNNDFPHNRGTNQCRKETINNINNS